MKATAALDAARVPDSSRPRPLHPTSQVIFQHFRKHLSVTEIFKQNIQLQRAIDTSLLESDTSGYHAVGIGRAPSPGYNISTQSSQSSVPPSGPIIRQDRDISTSHHIQSSQPLTQHPSQVNNNLII